MPPLPLSSLGGPHFPKYIMYSMLLPQAVNTYSTVSLHESFMSFAVMKYSIKLNHHCTFLTSWPSVPCMHDVWDAPARSNKQPYTVSLPVIQPCGMRVYCGLSTVAQKTVQVFACFGEIVLVQNADIMITRNTTY